MRQRIVDESFNARRAAAWCIGALLVVLISRLMPPIALFPARPADYATLHLVLEAFSIAVCAMIATLAWYGVSAQSVGAPSFLFVGFALVAGLDTLHACSFRHMPWIVEDGGIQQCVVFWLAARSVELITMAFVATRARLPLPRSGLLVLTALFPVRAGLDHGIARRCPADFVYRW